MDCVNHSGVTATAFCQNCGKPLCGNCVRNGAGGQILCEPCWTAWQAACKTVQLSERQGSASRHWQPERIGGADTISRVEHLERAPGDADAGRSHFKPAGAQPPPHALRLQ